MADGKAAFDYMNAFRADPTSRPPKVADWPVGDATGPYIWSDELFDLCLEHSINQAALGQISHDGVAERFDTVTSCQWNGWGENVAYNMENGDAALDLAITQWAESTSGHRENMLDQTKTYAAVAAAEKDGSVYFTAKFLSCFDGTEAFDSY